MVWRRACGLDMGNFNKNEDFSVIKFFVNFKDEIHIHFI